MVILSNSEGNLVFGTWQYGISTLGKCCPLVSMQYVEQFSVSHFPWVNVSFESTKYLTDT